MLLFNIVKSCQSYCFISIVFASTTVYMSVTNGINQVDMSNITLVSWNVRGLGQAVKWGSVCTFKIFES